VGIYYPWWSHIDACVNGNTDEDEEADYVRPDVHGLVVPDKETP